MALNLSGNGYSYTIPTGLSLRTFDDGTEIGGVNIPGRDGIFINPKTIRKTSSQLLLSGMLIGSSTNDLETKFETLSELLNSSPEPLIFDTGVRTIRVRKTNVTCDRIPSGGKKLRLAITFLAEDGFWQSITPVATSLGSFSGNPKAALKSVTVSGKYKTYPTILWKPSATIQDPTVTWYGKNLVKNGSFKDQTTDWASSGAPRVEKYANEYIARVDLNDYYYQDIPCNSSTTYYFSAYAVSEASTAARLTIEWYNSSDVLQSTDTIDYTVTSSLTRFSDSKVSHGSAAYCRLHIRTSLDAQIALVTKIQMEESATLSEYMPSQNIRFAIIGNTTFYNNDVLEVDMERKTVRWWDSGPPAWYNKIDVSNAQFFPLMPGKNLLAFTGENTNNAQVTVRYINNYLGY